MPLLPPVTSAVAPARLHLWPPPPPPAAMYVQVSRSICADSRRPPGRGALSDPVYLCVVAGTSAAVGAPSSSSTCTHAPAPHTTRASSGRCSSLFYSKRCHTYTHTYIYPKTPHVYIYMPKGNKWRRSEITI
jgi:hypothetical protein